MTKFKEILSLRRGSIAVTVLILSLFFFVEAIAAAGDIFLPIVYQDIKPTVTPTATATLIPGGVFVETNFVSDFTTSSGILHVVGEVRNTTGYHIKDVKVTANFYNKNNQLLDTRTERIFLNDLPAGEKTCFNLSLDAPPVWSKYQFEPVTYQTNGEPLPDLSLLGVFGSYSSQYKYYRITGSVRNDENVRVNQVKPVGTLYNLTQRVIGCEFTLVSGYYLDPGVSSIFEMFFFDRDYVDAATYRVQVDGDVP